jgi:cell division protein FtsI/penicillin-binding protein 2
MDNKTQFPAWRLAIVVGTVALSLVILGIRLVYIQLLNHEEYLAKAQQKHSSYQELFARRGAILDANGYPIAMSVDTYDDYIYRPVWNNDLATAEKTAQELSSVIGKSKDEIITTVRENGPAEFPIVRNVDYAAGQRISRLGLPGIRLQHSSQRVYPEGSLAAPLVGFVGFDGNGLTGVEHDLDAFLSGRPGQRVYEVDGLGNAIDFNTNVSPQPGADIILTIDRYIQRLAEQELDETIKKHRAKSGDIIVMDVRTGAILAMASRPSFDITNPDLANSRADVFKNRAVTDLYEPGSVFKLVTAAAALNEGKVTPHTTYVDNGVLKFEKWDIYNWDYSAHGVQTVTELLQKSLNTGSAWLSQLLGPETFYDYVRLFGFGQETGIGLGGEAAGSIRDWEHAQWSVVDMATNSFGQGLSATPLQVITAVAAIANDGLLMHPHVVKEIAGPKGQNVTQPRPVRQVIKPETARTLSNIMKTVVDNISAAQVPGYDAAGKTGTSSIARGSSYSTDTFIASFAGFIPLSQPQVAILVKVDEPKDVPWGSAVAAPVFGRLAKRIMEYLRVPPEKAFVQEVR